MARQKRRLSERTGTASAIALSGLVERVPRYSLTTSAELTHAIDYASMHGVICLASAGNAGRHAVVFPGGYRNVMAIGSTTTSDQRSTFSNYGDHLVTFAAPGEKLITLYPGRRYAAVSGTSFSNA